MTLGESSVTLGEPTVTLRESSVTLGELAGEAGQELCLREAFGSGDAGC